MVNRIKRNDIELFDSFKEQLDFINNAAILYDSGNIDAIKMASPSLRSLFYQQKFGPILIDIIKGIDKNRFLSTSTERINSSTILYQGPVSEDFFYYKGELKASYFPNCYAFEFNDRFLPFDEWWNETILVHGEAKFTRSNLIKFIANQDGGAHVDEKINELYYSLTKSLFSSTIKLIPEEIEKKSENLHLALLRQIAHETITSFNKMGIVNINYSNGSDSIFNQHRTHSFSGFEFGVEDLDKHS
ncbi:hypothetical protein [uncultured Rummeliibacillus sp.]|mgnify:CR=1 FL=1|uniref:hypothetical protein n=1 Tax=uncultured Rummeliibacillus sp. TaxID=762292 RepID=UPI00260246DE|nr:hypothetical protein [uncultured Rummeliibacillus sp.]